MRIVVTGQFPDGKQPFRGRLKVLGQPKVGDTLVGAVCLDGPYSIAIVDEEGRTFTSSGRPYVGITRPGESPDCLDFAFAAPKERELPSWLTRLLSRASADFPESLFFRDLPPEWWGDSLPVFIGEIHSVKDEWHIHARPADDVIPLAREEPASALEEAIAQGQVLKVRQMLDKQPDLATIRLRKTQTPLHVAAFYGQCEVARLLIKNKANVNAKTDRGATPLYFATLMNNTTALARLLLENGADVDAATGDGQTPLHRAPLSSTEMVRLLLSFGAKVDVKDNHGKTPLDIAIMFEKQESIELLKEAVQTHK